MLFHAVSTNIKLGPLLPLVNIASIVILIYFSFIREDDPNDQALDSKALVEMGFREETNKQKMRSNKSSSRD